MFKQLATVCAVAAGLALAPGFASSANALPIVKTQAADSVPTQNLILARGGHHGGGGFGGGGGGGFRGGGGGGHAFRSGGGGGNFRAFSAQRSFNSAPRAFNRGNYGGGSFNPGKNWSGNNWKGGKQYGNRHNRRFYGGGYYPYYGSYYNNYDYAYDDTTDCEWLRRKAIRTGSSYWWRRYEQCAADY